MRKHIAYLQKRNLIKCRRVEREYQFAITKDGKVAVSWARIRGVSTRLPTGRYCFVVFDIPEYLRNLRNHFRGCLKRSGFKQKQLSAWCTEYDVAALLKEQVHALGIEKYVIVLESVLL